MADFIPQFAPWFDKSEALELANYMDSDGYLTEFRVTQQLEQAICDYSSSEHAIMTNSGTTALMTMLYACSIGPGDEVIVPNYTMVATPNAVRAVGATPVLVDIGVDTLSLDLEKARAAVTPRTKAIFLVLANGREPSPGIDAFVELCSELDLFLLEDAAQALGSFYRDGRAMGTVGTAGMISFSVPKIITTGQGGCVLTSDEAFAAKARGAKDFGRERGGVDIHPDFGLNFKFTDLQAAVGVAQMRKLEERVSLKKSLLTTYKQQLAGIPEVLLFQQDLELTTPWFIDIAVPDRQKLVDHLAQEQIGSRPMYPPINSQPTYGLTGDFPISTWVGEHGLWLPSSSQLTPTDLSRVTSSIAEFYAQPSNKAGSDWGWPSSPR